MGRQAPTSGRLGLAVVAAWPGERAAEAGRQPRPGDDRRVPGLRARRMGAATPRGDRPVPVRRPGGGPPGGAQRGLPPAAAGHPRRRPEGAQQRHRLRVPPAHRVRLADRSRRRPRAGRRARARARRGRRRAGDGHEAVLYFRPLADRDSDEFFADARYGEFWVGARPDARRRRARARPRRAPHRRARRRGGQGRRRGHRAPACATPTRAHRAGSTPPGVENGAAAGEPAGGRRRPRPRHLAPADAQGRLRGRADARGRGGDPPRVRGDGRRAAARPSRRVAASAGSRASSPCTPATAATASATTRSARPATTRTRCTGSATTATCATATWCSSTPASRSTRSTPPTSPAPCPSPARSPTPSARSTTPCYAAQEAGIAAVRPGAKFSDVHAAAIRVIAEHLHAWGLLPEGVSVEDSLDKDHGQYHRRWMVHGTSHHLGLDVHDCALATREEYMDAVLEPGMVLTVEPGLYFKADDLLVPERFRGIGVRIEDDVVVTEDGCENLSAAMPRDVGRRRGLDRPGPETPEPGAARQPRRMTSNRAACSTPAAWPPPPRIMPSSSRGAGNSGGQRGVVGRVRLERVHRRLEVLTRHVDEVRGRGAARHGEHLHPTPRLEALVGELGVQPAVAGVRDGIQRGEPHGAVVGLVDHAAAEALVPGLGDDEVGAVPPDGAGDVPAQRARRTRWRRRGGRRSRRSRPRPGGRSRAPPPRGPGRPRRGPSCRCPPRRGSAGSTRRSRPRPPSGARRRPCRTRCRRGARRRTARRRRSPRGARAVRSRVPSADHSGPSGAPGSPHRADLDRRAVRLQRRLLGADPRSNFDDTECCTSHSARWGRLDEEW